jgi:hypothetical protein
VQEECREALRISALLDVEDMPTVHSELLLREGLDGRIQGVHASHYRAAPHENHDFAPTGAVPADFWP